MFVIQGMRLILGHGEMFVYQKSQISLARTWGETTFAVVQHPPPQGYIREAMKTGCVHYVTEPLTLPLGDISVYGSSLGGQRATRAYLFHKADLPSEHGWPKFWLQFFLIKWRLELYALQRSLSLLALENIDVGAQGCHSRHEWFWWRGTTGECDSLACLFFFFHSFFCFLN